MVLQKNKKTGKYWNSTLLSITGNFSSTHHFVSFTFSVNRVMSSLHFPSLLILIVFSIQDSFHGTPTLSSCSYKAIIEMTIGSFLMFPASVPLGKLIQRSASSKKIRNGWFLNESLSVKKKPEKLEGCHGFESHFAEVDRQQSGEL